MVRHLVQIPDDIYEALDHHAALHDRATSDLIAEELAAALYDAYSHVGDTLAIYWDQRTKHWKQKRRKHLRSSK